MSLISQQISGSQLSQSLVNNPVLPEYGILGFSSEGGGSVFTTNNTGSIIPGGDVVSSSWGDSISYTDATSSISASRFTSSSYTSASIIVQYAPSSSVVGEKNYFIVGGITYLEPGIWYTKTGSAWALNITTSIYPGDKGFAYTASYSTTSSLSASVAEIAFTGSAFNNFTASTQDNVVIPTDSAFGWGFFVGKDTRILRKGAGNRIFGLDLGQNITNTPLEYPWDSSVINPPNPIKIYNSQWNLIVLGDDENLYIAGDNSYGQLGDGTTTARYTLKKVEFPNKWASANGSHLAIKDFYAPQTINDEVTDCNILVRGTTVLMSGSVTSSYRHELHSWGGRNNRGMAGSGATTTISTPTVIYNSTPVAGGVSNIDEVKYLHMSNNYFGSCGTKIYTNSKNRLYSWGDNTDGQLARAGYHVSSSAGYFPSYGDNEPVSDPSYGGYAGQALSTFWTMQDMKFGRTYDGSTNRYFSVWRGKFTFNTVYPQLNNQLYVAGNNSLYQGGNGTTVRRSGIFPVKTGPWTNVVTDNNLYNISKYDVAGDGLAALDSTGSLWVTGRNRWGWFGDGTAPDTYANYAKVVQTNVSDFFVTSDLSSRTTLITVTNDGKNWVSGCNTNGQLGLGITDTYINTRTELVLPCGGTIVGMTQLGNYRFSDSLTALGLMIKTNKNRVYVAGNRYATNNGTYDNNNDRVWQEVPFFS